MKNRCDRGFSLVEIIVVIAVMAVLVGVLTPQYLRYVKKTRKANDLVTAREIGNSYNILTVDDKVIRQWTDLCRLESDGNLDGSGRYYYMIAYADADDSDHPFNVKCNHLHSDEIPGYTESDLNSHLQSLFDRSLSEKDVRMKFKNPGAIDQWIIAVDGDGRMHVLVGTGFDGSQSYISEDGNPEGLSTGCYELWPNTFEEYDGL
ncbi:MAG: type II secretion system GspH family protein [Lachnospiraceae bacterium]|nr:type II secretion system GspH family protein [Lachnospiraceae bacterium]